MTADPNQSANPTALAAAVAENNIDAVKALIKADVDLRPANWYDTPILVSAAAQGCVDIVQLLITARANVNNGYQSLPLSMAAEHGHLEVVRLLLTAGAYLNAQDGKGYTALMAAAATGQLAVVRFLVSVGAKFTATGTGETALTLAHKGGHQSVYAFLHAAVTPTAAPPPPTAAPQQQPSTSVLDDMIAHAAEELNELLGEATPKSKPNTSSNTPSDTPSDAPSDTPSDTPSNTL